jgi:hypothetical protein
VQRGPEEAEGTQPCLLLGFPHPRYHRRALDHKSRDSSLHSSSHSRGDQEGSKPASSLFSQGTHIVWQPHSTSRNRPGSPALESLGSQTYPLVLAYLSRKGMAAQSSGDSPHFPQNESVHTNKPNVLLVTSVKVTSTSQLTSRSDSLTLQNTQLQQ